MADDDSPSYNTEIDKNGLKQKKTKIIEELTDELDRQVHSAILVPGTPIQSYIEILQILWQDVIQKADIRYQSHDLVEDDFIVVFS